MLFGRRFAGKMSGLGNAPRDYVRLLRNARSNVRAIQQSTTIAPEYKPSERAKAIEAAQQKLMEQHLGHLNTIDEIARAAKKQLRPSHGERFEVYAARAWPRFKALVENGVMDWTALIDRESEDKDSLLVLRSELRDHLAISGQDERGELAEALLNRIDQHLRENHYTGDDAVAFDMLEELRTGTPRLNTAYKYALAEFNGTWDNALLIPGWTDDESIDVAPAERSGGVTEGGASE